MKQNKVSVMLATLLTLAACADAPGRLPPVTDRSQVETVGGTSRISGGTPREAEEATVDDDEFFRKPNSGLQRSSEGEGVDTPSTKTRRIEAEPLEDGPASPAQGAERSVSQEPAHAAAEEGLPVEPIDSMDGNNTVAAITTTAPSTLPEASVSAGTVNKAVENLVTKADKQSQSGAIDGAAHTIERALRLEPKNPYLWHRMASLRLKQGQNIQAEQTAQKSNSLASGDRELQSYNWRIIGAARRANGDGRGAKEAEQNARTLE
jgi:hypothetical protein